MKKLLSILFVLISVVGYSQSTKILNSTGDSTVAKSGIYDSIRPTLTAHDSLRLIDYADAERLFGGSTGAGWALTGNSGLVGPTYALGTTDNHPLRFIVNNSKAGLIDSSGGTGGTFFGLGAGNSNTGQYNSGFGLNSLRSNTSGADNTSTGVNALFSNTTGSQNVADGYGSLTSLTSGNGNIAVGYSSQQLTSSGAGNIALGNGTLYTLTTGSNNIAVGNNDTVSTNASGVSIFANGINWVSKPSNSFLLGSSNQLFYFGYGGMNTTAINALTPLPGAWVWNSDSSKYGYYNGSSWIYGGSGGGSYTLPVGTPSVLGGIKPDNVTIVTNGTTGATSIPIGSATTLGLYKAGTGLIVVGDSLEVLAGAGSWSTTGNAGLTGPNYFLGMTDNHPLNFQINGYRFGHLDSTGSTNNTDYGFRTGIANTTGNANTWIGFNAGLANTSGSDNTGVGTNALLTNTTGSQCTVMGYQAGTSANANGLTLFGYNSGQLITSGITNVGFGNNTLVALTTGNSDINVGANDTVGTATSNTTIIGIGVKQTASNVFMLGSSTQDVIVGGVANQTDNGNKFQVYGTSSFSGQAAFPAATSSASSLLLTSSAGTNPTSATSGMLWWNGTNLYFNNGSANKDLLASSGGSQTLQQVFNVGSGGDQTLTKADTVTVASGTSSWKWFGLSEDTTSAVGVYVSKNDSSQGMLPWSQFALKIADYLPSYNVTAFNGLYATGGDSVGLGTNPLTQNTSISQNGFTMQFSGTTGSQFDVNSDEIQLVQNSSSGIPILLEGLVASGFSSDITSGTSSAAATNASNIYINPSSTMASYTLTLPSVSTNGALCSIHFGGTLTSGTVVTSLTISAPVGTTIVQSSAPTTATAGTCIIYRLHGTIWYREQ